MTPSLPLYSVPLLSLSQLVLSYVMLCYVIGSLDRVRVPGTMVEANPWG